MAIADEPETTHCTASELSDYLSVLDSEAKIYLPDGTPLGGITVFWEGVTRVHRVILVSAANL